MKFTVHVLLLQFIASCYGASLRTSIQERMALPLSSVCAFKGLTEDDKVCPSGLTEFEGGCAVAYDFELPFDKDNFRSLANLHFDKVSIPIRYDSIIQCSKGLRVESVLETNGFNGAKCATRSVDEPCPFGMVALSIPDMDEDRLSQGSVCTLVTEATTDFDTDLTSVQEQEALALCSDLRLPETSLVAENVVTICRTGDGEKCPFGVHGQAYLGISYCFNCVNSVSYTSDFDSEPSLNQAAVICSKDLKRFPLQLTLLGTGQCISRPLFELQERSEADMVFLDTPQWCSLLAEEDKYLLGSWCTREST